MNNSICNGCISNIIVSVNPLMHVNSCKSWCSWPMYSSGIKSIISWFSMKAGWFCALIWFILVYKICILLLKLQKLCKTQQEEWLKEQGESNHILNVNSILNTEVNLFFCFVFQKCVVLEIFWNRIIICPISFCAVVPETCSNGLVVVLCVTSGIGNARCVVH